MSTAPAKVIGVLVLSKMQTTRAVDTRGGSFSACRRNGINLLINNGLE